MKSTSTDFSYSDLSRAGSPYSSTSDISVSSPNSSYQEEYASHQPVSEEEIPFVDKPKAHRTCSLGWWKASMPVIILHLILSFETVVFAVCVIYRELDDNSLFSYVATGVYGVLLVLTETSLFFAVFLTPGNVPPYHNPPDVILCKICDNAKPDRSHHCSNCGQCILRMDHHCPWIKNCVGLRNLKSFLLLCTYASLLSLIGGALMIFKIVINNPFTNDRLLDGVFLSIAIAIAIIIGCTLAAFVSNHYYLLIHNLTSLEYWGNRRKLEEAKGVYTMGCCARWCPITQPRAFHIYDLGCWGNCTSIFGKNPLLWCLPFPTYQGDGLDWPKNQTFDMV